MSPPAFFWSNEFFKRIIKLAITSQFNHLLSALWGLGYLERADHAVPHCFLDQINQQLVCSVIFRVTFLKIALISSSSNDTFSVRMKVRGAFASMKATSVLSPFRVTNTCCLWIFFSHSIIFQIRGLVISLVFS